MTQFTKEEINEVLNNFTETSYQHWGSYSYSAGALQSQLTTLLANSPADVQVEALNLFMKMTAKYSKQKESV